MSEWTPPEGCEEWPASQRLAYAAAALAWPDAPERVVARLAGYLRTWPEDPAALSRLRVARAEHDRVAAEPDEQAEAEEAATGDVPALGPAVLVRVSSVQPERVRWLWVDRLPLRKVAVLDGDPGLGKSTLTLDLAARITRGGALPEDERDREPADVVILSAEDGIADTIRPRLEAAGADVERVHVLTMARDAEGKLHEPSIPGDVEAIRYAVRETRAVLVVVDPLMAYLGARVDSHRDQDVRGALRLLHELADSERCAVLIIRHLNKSPGASALYRGGGSIGIIGAARAGLLVAPDKGDPERRILAATKSNLGPMPPALAYRLEPTPEGVARVAWDGIAEGVTAGDLLRPEADDRAPREQAADWLRELLAEGPLPSADVRRQADAAGHPWATVRRAKADVGIVVAREGFGRGGAWLWRLPAPIGAHDPHRCSPSEVSPYGEGEHLWDGADPPEDPAPTPPAGGNGTPSDPPEPEAPPTREPDDDDPEPSGAAATPDPRRGEV